MSAVARHFLQVMSSEFCQVMVIHSHVVAHQAFAMRLIGWLDGVLGYSEGFRWGQINCSEF